MKQHSAFLLICAYSCSGLIFTNTCDIQDKNKVIAHSFMFTHPASFNHVARQSIWHSFINNKCGSKAFQAISVVQQSFPDKKTAEYFLFCKNSELSVLGDTAPGTEQRDVRAEWLGIDSSDFTGVLQIDPKQSQLGVIFEYHIDLKDMDTIKALQDYWVSITIPTFLVKNDMNLKQVSVSNRALLPPRDIVEAFRQPAWEFGKIDGQRSEIGINCFDIRIGKTYHSKNSDEVVYYTGVSIPVGPHQNAEYVFDSFRGNNGHFGIFAGINFQLVVNRNSYYHQICWFFDLETLFLIRNSQNRVFDLRDKPWSRYLLLNRKDGPPNQNIPAINILTVFSRVRPYDLIDFSTGFRIIGPHVEAELGYNVWGHSSERVRINCNFPEIYGIAGKGSLIHTDPCINPEAGASASKSTIACQADNDDQFIVICQSDLDLKSAAANHTTNHKFHVSVGYTYWGNCLDGFFGAGGFYEFPQKNAALTIGGVWFKLGAAF